MKQPLAVGSPHPEDIERLYREQFLAEARQGNPLTIERMWAIEARVKKHIEETVSAKFQPSA
jgi:hypothetical protein